MAVPKNKTSHARKSSRRSTVWKINAPELTACPNCGELTAAHKACTNCGMYNVGYQHNLAIGADPGFLMTFIFGFLAVLPKIIVGTKDQINNI